MIGDVLYVWQTEDHPGQWSTISAQIVGHLPPNLLISRNKDAAVKLMGPLATAHAEALGQKLRLSIFKLESYEEVI